MPGEDALIAGRVQRPIPLGGGAEEQGPPIALGAIGTRTNPALGAAEFQIQSCQSRLLQNLASSRSDHILTWQELAPEPIEDIGHLAPIGSTLQQQHLLAGEVVEEAEGVGAGDQSR